MLKAERITLKAQGIQHYAFGIKYAGISVVLNAKRIMLNAYGIQHYAFGIKL